MTTTTRSDRASIEAYLYALATRGSFAEFFTERVTFDMVGAGETVTGRDEVAKVIRSSHEEVFDGRMVLRSLAVDTAVGRAAIEADFVGRHTGEFAGIEATGREVRVPYSVHYDLVEERISALRIYGLAPGLVAAVTGPA